MQTINTTSTTSSTTTISSSSSLKTNCTHMNNVESVRCRNDIRQVASTDKTIINDMACTYSVIAARQISRLLCVGDELVTLNGFDIYSVFPENSYATDSHQHQEQQKYSNRLHTCKVSTSASYATFTKVISLIRELPRPLVLGFISSSRGDII